MISGSFVLSSYARQLSVHITTYIVYIQHKYAYQEYAVLIFIIRTNTLALTTVFAFSFCPLYTIFLNHSFYPSPAQEAITSPRCLFSEKIIFLPPTPIPSPTGLLK